MAYFWISVSKIFQCVEKFYKSTKKTKYFTKSNTAFIISTYTSFKKSPLLILPSLCSITRKEEKTKEKDATEEVVHNVALATIALKDGDVEKSEKMLMKTLDLAETNNFHSGVISACDMLSSLAMKSGHYDKAENLLMRALDNLLKQGTPEDDNFVVSFNLKLSRIYSNNGNDDLAEMGFKNCLDIQKNKLDKNMDEETFLLWTTILYWYGKFLLSKNRYQEAKSCFKDCYLTSLRVEELLPSQIMVILYNLGEVCQNLGEHDEALEHLLNGISLDKKCRNPDLTYFYTKMGIVSMCKGLYKEAELWCNQGRKFALKYQNSDAEKESRECLEKINNFFVM